MAAPPPLLEIQDLTRQLGGTTAIDGVSLTLARGEIVGLMGASGAGKSSLLHTLAGCMPPSPQTRSNAPHRGRVLWNGREVTDLGPRAAATLGIVLVPQNPEWPASLTVAEAVSLGHEPVKFGSWLDRREMTRRATEWLERLGTPLAPIARLATLGRAGQQMVALARALAMQPSLLLLDAPTSALRPQETDRLFEILGDLQAQGTAILYVTDRLGEIEALANRVVVMRDGKVSGILSRQELNPRSLGTLLVGNDLELPLKELIEPGVERLRVEGVRSLHFPDAAVNFTAREGEIVGLAGLVGSGRTSLLRTLFGLDRRAGGPVVVDDHAIPAIHPRASIAAGMVFVPDNAHLPGAADGFSLRDTLALPSLSRLSAAGVVSRAAVDRLAHLMNNHLSITDGPLDRPLDHLTPGQLRKAAFAQWLALRPTVVLLDEPTRGVDMATRAAIYESMERLAERGAAVVFASNSCDELLRVADRLIVFREGAVAGTLSREDDFTERGTMRLAAGLAT
jgi:ribose transport system ATP-binding protein